jgi:ABC-2 type transport system permease protein
MRTTLSLIRREFTAYFWSPVAYVALGVFLLGLGLLFHFTTDLLTAKGPRGIEFPMQGLLGNVGFWLIFWVIPPLLTMRLLAEERSTGTLEMLMTAPVTDRQVVRSKFLACYGFYLLLLLPTLAYLPVLLDLHVVSASDAPLAKVKLGEYALRFGIDPFPVLASYLGLALAGAMFLALGLWVSSLVRSQIVAALLALALNLVFLLGGLLVLGGFYALPSDPSRLGYRVLEFFSVPLHFAQDFSRGIIDTRHVVLYVTVTLAGLFLTVRSLESRRWR